MDKMKTLMGSSSNEASKTRQCESSSLSSFKSSLASLFNSPAPKSTQTKTSSISEIHSEEHSTELYEDDLDEECEKKIIANFQKNYLELGQWPEVPVPVFQAFKLKYRGMKQKLKECRAERDKLKTQLIKYQNGEIPCKSCETLREKNSKTRIALEQAIQLSNMLLGEVKRLESCNSIIE